VEGDAVETLVLVALGDGGQVEGLDDLALGDGGIAWETPGEAGLADDVGEGVD
jgi:hypothetical protein